MTNYDRLVHLSADEFARLWHNNGRCLPKLLDGDYPAERCKEFPTCTDCITDYLKSEVQDDG